MPADAAMRKSHGPTRRSDLSRQGGAAREQNLRPETILVPPQLNGRRHRNPIRSLKPAPTAALSVPLETCRFHQRIISESVAPIDQEQHERLGVMVGDDSDISIEKFLEAYEVQKFKFASEFRSPPSMKSKASDHIAFLNEVPRGSTRWTNRSGRAGSHHRNGPSGKRPTPALLK